MGEESIKDKVFIKIKSGDGVDITFDVSGITEKKCPKLEKRFKGRGIDLLNWNNENLAKLLDYFDENAEPSDFLAFWFKENGVEKSATLYKGNYQGFDCAYHIIIGKDVDLFNNRDEVKDFLVYLAKCE